MLESVAEEVRMMPNVPYIALLAGAVFFAGCATPIQQVLTPKETETATPTVKQSAPTLLERWITEASTPSTVDCGIDPDEAPNAVARFMALSERISTIYKTIYEDAKRVADGTMPTPDVQPGEDWRPSVQAAITARYQAAMRDIDAARKDLDLYVDTLGDDDAITNNLQRTRLRTQLGQGATRLEALLNAADRAATLMREQGLSDISGR